MTAKLADRVKETSTSTGSGTINLDGAVSGFQTFVAGIGSGNSCYYCITGGTEWEVGIGSVTDATPDTLSRTTILASSNSGSAVSFSAGTKDVFCTIPASHLGIVQIAQVVSPGAATITFSSIPGHYGTLIIELVGRDTKTANAQKVYIKFNSDGTAGNYIGAQYSGNSGSATVTGGSTSTSASGIEVGAIPAASDPANESGYIRAEIGRYADTTFFKKILSHNSVPSGTTEYTTTYGLTWKSAAAITQIDLTTQGTAFATGTVATLLGIS